MTIRLPALTSGGTLLTAVLIFTAYTGAQTSSPSPPSPTLSTLSSFNPPGPNEPFAGVVIGSGGVLYGTTLNTGTVFSLTPPASPGGPWTEFVLHTFLGNCAVPCSDGSLPIGGVVIGSGGVLYGTTQYGGTSGYGTVFSVTPPASAGGEAVLYNFTGGSDGAEPTAGVVIGKGGELYGTTFGGGTDSTCAYGPGCGTVFSLTPPASPGGAWTESVLHSFAAGGDGTNPAAGVVIGKGGVLYGTTFFGGSSGAGTVFSLTPPASPGGAWTEAVLYNFTGGSDGGKPEYGGVVIGKGGVLYGTTSLGGTGLLCGVYAGNIPIGCGTVFSLTPPTSPGGAWTETVLYSFAGLSDGANPIAGVVIGKGGVLYGTTESSGASGAGTVFSLAPPASPGGAWAETVLHTFLGSLVPPCSGDGAVPLAGVVIGGGGVLYGTTFAGGTACVGTVFSLKP